MKRYEGKTKEECIVKACKEFECSEEQLIYKVEIEKKGILGIGKSCTIAVLEIQDVVDYAEKYVQDVTKSIGLEVSTKPIVQEGLIKILIETDHNPLLIGRNGETLRSLNELVKVAVSTKFGTKFRILLDVSEYKNKKYSKVIGIAKRVAKNVLRTHVDAKLDPMTPDERKKVHNALASWKNIKTESVGDGKDRSIVIKYTGPANAYPTNGKRKNSKNRRPKQTNSEEIIEETVITTEKTVTETSSEE